MRGVSVAAVGVAMLAVAAVVAPPAARPLLVPAGLALAVSLAGRWPVSGTCCALAAAGLTAAAVLTGRAGLLAATAEGLLVTGYLLLLDRVETGTRPLRSWLAAHGAALLAAAAGAAVLTAVAVLPAPPGPIAALAGTTAAVTAYWYALHPH